MELDLNVKASGAILDALHLINMAKGRGKVTSYSRVRGELKGVAMRRVNYSHYCDSAYRSFQFKLKKGKDGFWRVTALGLTRKLEMES